MAKRLSKAQRDRTLLLAVRLSAIEHTQRDLDRQREETLAELASLDPVGAEAIKAMMLETKERKDV